MSKDKYINDCKALQLSTEGSTSEIRQLDRTSECQECTINTHFQVVYWLL